MNRFCILVFVLSLPACNAIPGNSPLKGRNPPEYTDEYKKQKVSEVVRYLEGYLGGGSTLTIKSFSPRGYDFSAIVRDYGSHSVITYSSMSAELYAHFDIEKIDGIYTGPTIRNYRITATLARPNSLQLGMEILMQSTQTISCKVDRKAQKMWQCRHYIPKIAEFLLYQLKPVGMD